MKRYIKPQVTVEQVELNALCQLTLSSNLADEKLDVLVHERDDELEWEEM